MSMEAELRFVKSDGVLGEILPHYVSLSYMDDPGDVGEISFQYPIDGANYEMLDYHKQIAILLDGKELPLRFRIDEIQGNEVTEDEEDIRTWAGQSLLAMTDEVLMMPRENTNPRTDVLTKVEERKYRELADEWLKKQRKDNADAEQSDKKSGEDKVEDVTTGDANDDGKLTWKDYQGSTKWENKISTAPPPTPPKWKNATPGKIMLDIFHDAKKRGLLKDLQPNFTAEKDSAGNKWKEKITHKWEIGTTMLGCARWMDEHNIAEMRTKRWTLELYNSNHGKNHVNDIVLAEAYNIEDSPVYGSARDITTAAYVVSDSGVHGWVTNPVMIKKWGRLESILSVDGVKNWDAAEKLGKKYLEKFSIAHEAYTYGVTPGSGQDPYDKYQIGDYIGVMINGRVSKQRVRAITLDWDETDDVKIVITVGQRILPKQVKQDRQNKATNGRSNTPSSSSKAKTAAQSSDGEAPKRPSKPKVSARSGVVRVKWDGKDEDGKEPSWDQKHVEIHVSDKADFAPNADTLVDTLRRPGSRMLSEEDYNSTRHVRLIAVDEGDDKSDPSDSEEVKVTPVGQFQVGEDTVPHVSMKNQIESGSLDASASLRLFTANALETNPAIIRHDWDQGINAPQLNIFGGERSGISLGRPSIRIESGGGTQQESEIRFDTQQVTIDDTNSTGGELRMTRLGIRAVTSTGVTDRLGIGATHVAIGNTIASGGQELRLFPDGTMASRTAGNALGALVLNADVVTFDVTGGLLRIREASGLSNRGQLAATGGATALTFMGTLDRVRVSNLTGATWQPIEAASFAVNSDAGGKKDSVAVDKAAALAGLLSLPVYEYERIDNPELGRVRGVMAQDVASLFPAVHMDSDGPNSQGVDVYGLLCTLIAALQSLASKVR